MKLLIIVIATILYVLISVCLIIDIIHTNKRLTKAVKNMKPASISYAKSCKSCCPYLDVLPVSRADEIYRWTCPNGNYVDLHAEEKPYPYDFIKNDESSCKLNKKRRFKVEFNCTTPNINGAYISSELLAKKLDCNTIPVYDKILHNDDLHNLPFNIKTLVGNVESAYDNNGIVTAILNINEEYANYVQNTLQHTPEAGICFSDDDTRYEINKQGIEIIYTNKVDEISIVEHSAYKNAKLVECE